MTRRLVMLWLAVAVAAASAPRWALGNDLEARLRSTEVDVLAARARLRGNPRRGAFVFFQSAAACSKCHSDGSEPSPLGPPLATLGQETDDHHIIRSLLEPSQTIREGYETLSVVTADGSLFSGLFLEESDTQLKLRDASDLEKTIVIARDEIEQRRVSDRSMMPDGLLGSLGDERDFYDLVRYIGEVARGGLARADELRPSAERLRRADDTQGLDHAGILRSLGPQDLAAGERIYRGHCVNCHGADGNTPTLPMARAFGNQPLKFGADPYRMFLTVSRGAGLMAPLTHLAPRERYQVVHYIRERLMRDKNAAYRPADGPYLDSLPRGEGSGEFVQETDRDYGPVLASQLGRQVQNALTFRLDDDISVAYDLHRMRLGGVWRGGFLDLSETHHARQRGEGMPRIDGEPLAGLGDWGWAFGGSFEIGENDKPPRGPLRDDWLRYRGHYLWNDQAILSYSIEGRDVLETLSGEDTGPFAAVTHTLRIAPGANPMRLSVARLDPQGGPAGVMAEGDSEPRGLAGRADGAVAVTSGRADEVSEEGRFPNVPRWVVSGDEASRLDLGSPGRTVIVRFRTTAGGTLVASSPPAGAWERDGKTLFIRDGRLVFDIGWVGAIVGRSVVNDGKWHTAAVVVDPERTRLFVDGKPEGQRESFRREAVPGHVLKIGATATNFGGDFRGDIARVRIVGEAWDADRIDRLADVPADVPADDSQDETLLAWEPGAEGNFPAGQTPGKGGTDVDRRFAAAMALGDTDDLTWHLEPDGRIVMEIPPSGDARVVRIVRCATETHEGVLRFRDFVRSVVAGEPVVDPVDQTRGGGLRWPQVLKVRGERGEPINGYALDTIPVPFENPWRAWLRTSGHDFLDDGTAVVATYGGDIYQVRGLDDELAEVEWKRYAAGLFEPFGVRVVDGLIYVTCRDGIRRLHDLNGNGEADFVEAFWIDDDLSCTFHAFNFDLQTDRAGNFYLAKSGQYSDHHRPGSIMKVPPQGGRAEVVAWGLRTPNGMGRLPGDRLTVSDNQGPWIPAGKISLIRPGGFMGNMPINRAQDDWLRQRHGGELPESFDPPLIWMPQELDNSCGGQIWVDDPRFGPLAGRLLHSSFGKGWLYYLSIQEVGGVSQASMVALPHQWDAGVMRLRVSPRDGQLYGTGLSGWQGPAGGNDGCLQRLRYTGQPVRFIEDARVTSDGLELRFSFPVDPASAADPDHWQIEMWNYLWSAKYGSDQFSVVREGQPGHDPLPVRDVQVEGDRVRLKLPGLRPCDQLSVEMRLRDDAGEWFTEHLYMTVNAIPSR